MTDVLVGGNQQMTAGFLRQANQLIVRQVIPSHLRGGMNCRLG